MGFGSINYSDDYYKNREFFNAFENTPYLFIVGVSLSYPLVLLNTL